MNVGRPPGTFADPALRARAWHWLGAVEALAKVDKARHLDRPTHVLSQGLPLKARFDQIRQDGYDPAAVCARGKTSLLDHVARKQAFKTTRSLYGHMLWKHLVEWVPLWREREAWLVVQLRQHDIVRYESGDEAHAVDLGLLNEPDQFDPGPPPLNLDPDRFATLDGLLLLLVLHREAQDAAHHTRATRLKTALEAAAHKFADGFQYRDEVLDTWCLLLGSRMVAWHPKVQPTEKELKEARKQLQPEIIPARQKPTEPPNPKSKTRSERRWRRRVWVRACCLYLDRAPGWPYFDYDYRDACPLFEWLTEHREAIHQHRVRAMELLVVGELSEESEVLPPLTMPATLYARRRRPLMTEEERWVFGNRTFYDVIPVTPISKQRE